MPPAETRLLLVGAGHVHLEILRRLGAGGGRARLLARTAPFAGPDRPWRRAARIAGAVSPVRAVAWVGQRGFFRIVDRFARHV